ncbi:LppU/SCO3897 family protein [Lentzea sp. HUAS TT2]|uniref:LppU/SCO3897 family protein n=1 Tax=Lentzea sp. HUAS TT2 TaxID=3447454 RepID=UPI003F6FF2B7
MSTESTDPVEPPAVVTPVPEESETDESPQNNNWLKFVIVGVLAIVLVGGGVWALTSLGGTNVGDCVSASPKDVDKPDGDWNISSKGCGDSAATHRVAAMLKNAEDPCPAEGIYEPVKSGSETMCLMPNLAEGKCYTSSDDGAFKQENCTTESPVKIVKKVDGLPEEGTVCPEGSSELRFSEPASVYCMGVHEGS